MTASLLELRRVPETCGRRAVVVQAAARLAGSAGLSGWAVPGKFTAGLLLFTIRGPRTRLSDPS